MFFVNLKRALPTLTHSENRIAVCLTDNPVKLEGLTSYELAKRAGVGQSTIIRFSQKLGYRTFKDLIDDILENDADTLENSSISAEEDTVETVEKLRRSYVSTLDEILRYNPIQVIEQAVDAFYGAKRVFCYGAQSSNSLARLFANRLMEIGIEAYNTGNTFSAYSFIQRMQSNDVAFFISGSGESQTTIRLAGLAAERKARIICITGTQDSTLKSMAEISLCSPEYIIYTNLKSVTNRCSQLYLMDCLYLNLWKKAPDIFNESVARVDERFRNEFGGLPVPEDDT